MRASATGTSLLRPALVVGLAGGVAAASSLLVFRVPLADLDVALRANAGRMLVAALAGAAFGLSGALAGAGRAASLREPVIFAVSAGGASGVGLAALFGGGVVVAGAAGAAGAIALGGVILAIGRSTRVGTLLFALILPSMLFVILLSAGTGAALGSGFGGLGLWLAGDLSRAGAGGSVLFLALLAPILLVTLRRTDTGVVPCDRALPEATGLPFARPVLLGAAIGAAGPVAFVGWAAPALAGRLLGDEASTRARVGSAAALGAAILMAADALPRLLVGGYTLPLNVSFGAFVIPAWLWARRRGQNADEAAARGPVLAWIEGVAMALATLVLLGFVLAFVRLVRGIA